MKSHLLFYSRYALNRPPYSRLTVHIYIRHRPNAIYSTLKLTGQATAEAINKMLSLWLLTASFCFLLGVKEATSTNAGNQLMSKYRNLGMSLLFNKFSFITYRTFVL